uniref:Uncharacterized protein MANES_10G016400 n=1 Tax=Rhizophora mucronata TaxID=61149 RepID=A0A2P2JE31_RHIMU
MRGSLLFNRRGLQRFRQFAKTAVGSAKIKLLLCCCIAFTLLALAGRPLDFMGWTNRSAPLDRLPDSGYAHINYDLNF